MPRPKLDDDGIAARLASLPNWKRVENEIVRDHEAPTVRSAVSMIQRIADLAEGANHHPHLTWVYRSLRIALSTHDSGGITTRDFHLAHCIEDVLADE